MQVTHTQRRGAFAIETSRASVQCEVLLTGGAYRWRGGHGSQARRRRWQPCVWWSGSLAGLQALPVVRQWSELWVLIASMGIGATHISVYVEPLSKCPDLWFWAFQVSSKGIRMALHYLCLDIALDIMLVASSDSLLDCQKCSETPLCSYSVYRFLRCLTINVQLVCNLTSRASSWMHYIFI